MLTSEQRREIMAVSLLAVALCFLLALLPVSLFGVRGQLWFPSGNVMGVVGGTVRGLLSAFFGVTALLFPLLTAVAGLRAGEWMSSERALRWAVLLVGLLALAPIVVWVTVGAVPSAGWLGTTLGGPLVALLGRFGAGLVCAVGLVALSVATMGWNPLRSVGRGVVAGGDVAGRTARALAEKRRGMAESRAVLAAHRAELAAETEASPPMTGFEPEWLDSDEDGVEGEEESLTTAEIDVSREVPDPIGEDAEGSPA
jgi:hypothetical protein